MKIAVRAAASLALAALAACHRPDPTPPRAPAETAGSDAAAATDTATGAAAATDTDAATASETVPGTTDAADARRPPSAPPPSGLYTVTLSERSSSCPVGDAGAARSDNESSWVLVARSPDGAWSANLPMNTGGGAIAVDRHDLRLEVGHVERSAFQPDRTCAWEVSREMRVLEVSPTKVVVAVSAAYTDAVRCTLPRRPVSCARDVVLTYSLARPFCDPGCAAEMTRARDGGVDARCTCP